MSLISFHRFLIVTAIVFCLGFGLWEFNSIGSGGGTGAVILGSVFTLLGIGLSVYLRQLARFLGYEDDRSVPR
jgi:hypothetical protein